MSQSITHKPSIFQTHLPDVRNKNDDWTGITASKERKKRQNRLNQRAKRRRAAACAPEPEISEKGQLRFRLPIKVSYLATERAAQEDGRSNTPMSTPLTIEGVQSCNSVIAADTLYQALQRTYHTTDSPRIRPWTPTETLEKHVTRARTGNLDPYVPLPADNLLHLIHLNVLRALASNKMVLNVSALLFRVSQPVNPTSVNLCDGLTVLRANPELNLPPLLMPTAEQQLIPHSSWMNMFPLPRLRNNLLMSEAFFDHFELLGDLFGEVFNDNGCTRAILSAPVANPEAAMTWKASPPAWSTYSSPSSSQTFTDDSELTSDRKCFIVWADPCDINSWEVTPGFVRKWGWLLEGCAELILSSNRWRASRGEDPIPLDDRMLAKNSYSISEATWRPEDEVFYRYCM